MDISTGLIAKGTAGALAASAAVGGGIAAKGAGWLDGLFPDSEISGDVGHSQDGEVAETVPGGVPPSPTEGGQVNNPSRSDTDTVTVSGAGTGHDVSTQDNRQANDLSISDGSSAPSANGGSNPSGDGQNGVTVGGSSLQAEEPSTDPNSASQNLNHGGSTREGSGKKQGKNLTEWDEALINYLKDGETNNRDIVFAVTTGKDTKVALSTSFPSFEKDTGKKKLTITAAIATSNTNLKGTNIDDKISELRKMNGGDSNPEDWTWECTITISKEKKEDSIDLKDKEKLIGSDGFFNKLAGTGEKDLKIKFIENCAKTRGKNSTTLDGGKISAEKNFDLEQENGGTNWKIKDKDFNDWFSSTQAQ